MEGVCVMGNREIKEMLSSIKKDGVKWMCARGVIVTPDEQGFGIEVDKEEYAYSSTIREIIPDIQELQESRPFIKSVTI